MIRHLTERKIKICANAVGKSYIGCVTRKLCMHKHQNLGFGRLRFRCHPWWAHPDTFATRFGDVPHKSHIKLNIMNNDIRKSRFGGVTMRTPTMMHHFVHNVWWKCLKNHTFKASREKRAHRTLCDAHCKIDNWNPHTDILVRRSESTCARRYDEFSAIDWVYRSIVSIIDRLYRSIISFDCIDRSIGWSIDRSIDRSIDWYAVFMINIVAADVVLIEILAQL